jgi:hypothetical protein
MRRVWMIAAVALAAGCADGGPGLDRRPTVPVSGVVRAGGRPAAGARVVFTPAGGASAERPGAWGEVGPDGTFRLTTYAAGDGAVAGEYVVTVVWPGAARPRPPAGEDGRVGGEDGTDADAPAGPDPTAGRYADPKTSPLRRTVSAGTPALDPIDL